MMERGFNNLDVIKEFEQIVTNEDKKYQGISKTM